MITRPRRPGPAHLLLPVLLALLTALTVSGCSFRAGVTQHRTSASPPTAAPTAGGPTSPPPAPPPTTASGATSATRGATSATRGATSTTRGATSASSSPSPTAAGGTGTAGTTPGTTASSRAVTGSAAPGCRTADLRVTLADGGQGAAGSVLTSVVLVNTGTATCVLSGHPGVSYVAGADGNQVGAAAAREGTDLTPVTLAPGARASAPLRVVDPRVFDAATCRPAPVEGYRVYPPGQTASVFVARPGTACADPSALQLTVGTVRAAP